MSTITDTLALKATEYVAETHRLSGLDNTTEETFYPAIRDLIAGVLRAQNLPFEVRTGTSEAKAQGTDRPDFILADAALFVGVFGEVKKPDTTLEDIAASTERDNQVGRYLARTGVVIVTNVRGFGLLACAPSYARTPGTPVPPDQRELIDSVDLWANTSGRGAKASIDKDALEKFIALIVRSITDFAPIADPADLAKVLARQARDAKDALPDDLRPVAPLLDDYRQALGLSFDVDDEKGDRFFRSSLIQTAFYSLFAAWVLWDRTHDPAPFERLARLVGLDEYKARLTNILALLVNPAGLDAWAKKHHPGANGIAASVLRRPPLVVLAGDVGSGKSELAETIGDAVARQEKIEITLFPLSLSTRGQGRVGEMTQLLSAAFDYTFTEAAKLKGANGRSRGAVILLVDEADALAQSREAAQMHHEDRAGVNAFIRGVDRLANGQLHAAVIMCTNRLSALDPAVRRRAADVMIFARPTDAQRQAVLGGALAHLGFTSSQIGAMVAATGPQNGREYGFTFSDLTQRLLPAIVLDAYPAKPIVPTRALEIARAMAPTPPFQDRSS